MASKWSLTQILAIAVITASFLSGLSTAKTDDCPATGGSWSDENVARCIRNLSAQIGQLPALSPQRVALLEERAQLYEHLARTRAASGDKSAKLAYEAAVSDYSAALSIDPGNELLRRKRALLLIETSRGGEALKDAEALLAKNRTSVRNQELKGTALAAMKRHQEAIVVFTHAIGLAQSCAEASMLQRQVNKYRHAFDPPMTREQMREEVRNLPNRPLYDVPEASVKDIGFPCAPTPTNTLDDLVSLKEVLFERRAESYRALNNPSSAINDYEYALSISTTAGLGSIGLCEIEIDQRLDYSAVEHCRLIFGSNSYIILSDPELAAKIGNYLLDDGDLKSACRIALPYSELPAGALEPNKAMQTYLNHPKIKALQQRVKGGLAGAGLKRCAIEFGRPNASR